MTKTNRRLKRYVMVFQKRTGRTKTFIVNEYSEEIALVEGRRVFMLAYGYEADSASIVVAWTAAPDAKQGLDVEDV